MKYIVLSLTALVLFSCSLITNCIQGNGNVTTTTKPLDFFNEVELNGSADVKIIKSDKREITIETDDNLLDLVAYRIEESETLVIDPENICWTKLFITIYTPELEEIELDGSGSIVSKHDFSSDEFEVELNGSGDVDVFINSKDAEIKLNGSGDIIATGTSDKLEVKANGSGQINTYELQANDAKANLNGSGSILINASKSLEAKQNGSGRINYMGDPKLKVESNGSGIIQKR